MSKIGIVTITNNGSNYGNALQNYAVKRVFEKLGHEAWTICNVDGIEYSLSLRYKVKLIIRSNFHLGDYLFYKREIAFLKFRNKYLNDTEPVTIKSIKDKNVEYDFYSVGSDQVWNPEFHCNNIHLDYLFLKFIEPKKRIAYSASIGISKIPESFKEEFKNSLKDFKAISVRENTGKEIIENLINKNVDVLIDPTLMLDRKDWDNIKNKKIHENEKYVVVYFLGNMTDVLKNDLEELKSKGYKIHQFLNEDDPDLYSAGPEEFISWISNASCILTDSFHASVFAFIYNKPFYIYERCDQEENMMSRFDTFLKTFQLMNRLRKEVDSIELSCNYDEAYDILKIEQEKAYRFLKNALQENN